MTRRPASVAQRRARRLPVVEGAKQAVEDNQRAALALVEVMK